MFRDGDNCEREVLFLDFQAPMLNSPSHDLNTMLQLTCDIQVRERKEEVLFKCHRQLTQSLQTYGSKDKCPPQSTYKWRWQSPAPLVRLFITILRILDNTLCVSELFQILYPMPLVLIPDLNIQDVFLRWVSMTQCLSHTWKRCCDLWSGECLIKCNPWRIDVVCYYYA